MRVAHAPNPAFVDELIFIQGDVLNVMTVNEVTAHADTVLFAPVNFYVLLPHDILANHATRFVNIELIRQMAVLGELVFVQTDRLYFSLNVKGNGFVVGQEVQ